MEGTTPCRGVLAGKELLARMAAGGHRSKKAWNGWRWPPRGRSGPKHQATAVCPSATSWWSIEESVFSHCADGPVAEARRNGAHGDQLSTSTGFVSKRGAAQGGTLDTDLRSACALGTGLDAREPSQSSSPRRSRCPPETGSVACALFAMTRDSKTRDRGPGSPALPPAGSVVISAWSPRSRLRRQIAIIIAAGGPSGGRGADPSGSPRSASPWRRQVLAEPSTGARPSRLGRPGAALIAATAAPQSDLLTPLRP